jgi:hypothetical protein
MKGFVKLGDSTVINDIRENLIQYFDYNLLVKGNSVAVTSGTLTYSPDPRFSGGRVWEYPYRNLVWESGGISGVYVNGTYSSSTGVYPHYIDHTNGRAVFTSGISVSSTVRSNYSYKYVNVVKADGLAFFKQLSVDDTETSTESKLKPPIVGIELAGRRMRPYQLGGGQIITTDFLIHCISDDPYIRDTLADVVCYQNDASFFMSDLNSIADADAFPLDYRGVPNSGALVYPLLSASYPGRLLHIQDTKLDSSYSLGRLHVGTVRITTEVVHFGV